MFRTDKLSQSASFGLPEAVLRQSKVHLAPFYLFGKIFAWFLAFPSPPKVPSGLSGAPESRKTLRGKGATKRKGRVCISKLPQSERCDVSERRSLFVAKRLEIFEKLNAMRFFCIFINDVDLFDVFFLFFLPFCGLDFFYIPFLYPIKCDRPLVKRPV